MKTKKLILGPERTQYQYLNKMKTLTIFLLLCCSLRGQIQHSPDTTVCDQTPVVLWASGAYSYTWITNGVMYVEHNSTSIFHYPYNYSSWVCLLSLTDNGVDTTFITVTYVYCTDIKEHYPDPPITPIYYDLMGNKSTPVPGQIYIEQTGNIRRKILVQ